MITCGMNVKDPVFGKGTVTKVSAKSFQVTYKDEVKTYMTHYPNPGWVRRLHFEVSVSGGQS